MSWYEDAKKGNGFFVGTLLIVGLISGWGATEAVMHAANIDKVVAGTYVSKADVEKVFIPKATHEKALAQINQLSRSLVQSRNEIFRLNNLIAAEGQKKQSREELEKQKKNLINELDQKRKKLIMASQITNLAEDWNPSGSQASNNNIYYQSIQRDIESLEGLLESVNQKLLEMY